MPALPLKNNVERWGSISIGLHWLTFLMIVGLGTVGLIMTDLPSSPFKIQIYGLHKSIGLTVFALSLLRDWKSTRLNSSHG